MPFTLGQFNWLAVNLLTPPESPPAGRSDCIGLPLRTIHKSSQSYTKAILYLTYKNNIHILAN